jgi:hypothetical protein
MDVKEAVMSRFKILSKNIQRLRKTTNTSQATLFLSQDLNLMLSKYKEAVLNLSSTCVLHVGIGHLNTERFITVYAMKTCRENV